MLLYVTEKFSIGKAGPYYICERLLKTTNGVGYISDTDTRLLDCESGYVEFDPKTWDKIHKILKMNTLACNTIVNSCKKFNFPTGYYVTTFSIRPHYKIFEVLENYQVLVRFGKDQTRITKLKNSAIEREKFLSAKDEWISPEIYYKLMNNVKDTIKQVKDLWPTV